MTSVEREQKGQVPPEASPHISKENEPFCKSLKKRTIQEIFIFTHVVRKKGAGKG